MLRSQTKKNKKKNNKDSAELLFVTVWETSEQQQIFWRALPFAASCQAEHKQAVSSGHKSRLPW